MHVLRSLCPFTVAAAVAAVGLPSQQTHLVGPGGLPQIRDALAIAQPGDRIHVQAGTYAHFEANVGVTIRALVPGTVVVAVDAAFLPAGCVTNPFCAITVGMTKLGAPPGQTLHVVGVNFAANEIPATVPVRHRVEVTGGRVTFDTCEIRSLGQWSALSVGGATVHLQDCVISVDGYNGGHALGAGSATIDAVACVFQGGSTLGGTIPPGSGIRANNSSLHGSYLTIRSGGGLFPFGAQPANGLHTSGGPVWLTDSELIGSCAIHVDTFTPVLQRCTLTSTGTNCPAVTPSNDWLLAARRLAPLQPGAPFQIDYVTEPNGFVAIFAGPALGRLDLPGLLAQPSLLDETQSFVAGIVLADALGHATASWQIPAGPGIPDLTLWFKGLSGWTLPLQVSPIVGGVAR